MRKILEHFKKGNGALVLCVVCATAGSALFIPTTGLVTTLPFVALFTLLGAFFIKKHYILPPAFLALSYFFCFAKDVPLQFPDSLLGYSLSVAIAAGLISLLCCAARTMLGKTGKRRVIYSCVAALLIICAVLGNAYVNGTPWGAAVAKSEIDKYIDKYFTAEELTVGNVYYVSDGGYYACDANIIGTTDKGSFIYKDRVTDSFGELAVNYAAAGKVVSITQVLRKAFANELFSVTPSSNGFGENRFSFKKPASVLPYIDYTVIIHSEETAKSFVSKAEAYVAVIAASKLGCESITVVGGAKQKLYYSIKVDLGAPHGSLAKELRIHSNYPLPQNSVLSAHNSFGN